MVGSDGYILEKFNSVFLKMPTGKVSQQQAQDQQEERCHFQLIRPIRSVHKHRRIATLNGEIGLFVRCIWSSAAWCW
jgi:hypothetical protein